MQIFENLGLAFVYSLAIEQTMRLLSVSAYRLLVFWRLFVRQTCNCWLALQTPHAKDFGIAVLTSV